MDLRAPRAMPYCRAMTYGALLALPGVPALLGAMTLSRLAGRMFALALVLHALDRFGSPSVAGWLTFAAVAPGLLVSPIAGTVLDRLGAAGSVTVDLAVSAVLVTAIVATGWMGLDGLPLLAGLACLYSLTTPLGAAGVRTILPRLVPEAALDPANAADTAINAAVGVAGPVLAGLLAAWLGTGPALLVVAGVYAAGAICLQAVPPVPGPPPLAGSVLRQTAEGLATVLREPTLRGLAISYSLHRVTWGVLLVVVPVYAAARFGAEDAGAASGLLFAAMGIAGGVGALVAGRFRTLGRERQVLAAGMLVCALGAWPVGMLGLPGLALALALVGLASGPIDVALLTLRQRRTDPRQLGRVLSISMSLNLAGTPIGSALAGMLLTGSIVPALVLGALGSALGALAVRGIPRG
ncbi:MFS transporter [Rhodovarius crocodyli]|uniref:MFS transporter n=1 Tax=Rhodovarius crocodyli TaxID=1979269 RepID=A0A437MG34_9PROT|nr:MFS transporter [Rhodovarius crocodyli]RVT96604.1 MFS transporter [Rhodovarius crocodyli]